MISFILRLVSTHAQLLLKYVGDGCHSRLATQNYVFWDLCFALAVKCAHFYWFHLVVIQKYFFVCEKMKYLLFTERSSKYFINYPILAGGMFINFSENRSIFIKYSKGATAKTYFTPLEVLIGCILTHCSHFLLVLQHLLAFLHNHASRYIEPKSLP